MKPIVKLIAVTVGAGELEGNTGPEVISHNARVSNPNNQLEFSTSASSPLGQSFSTSWQVWNAEIR